MSQLITKRANTPLQNNLLSCLFDPEIGGDIRKAMKKAGYADTSSVKEIIEPLKEQILELAQSVLAINAPKAVMGLLDVIDSPAQLGSTNKINAANSVLDRIGITKKDDTAMKVPKGAIVFLPPKENTKINVQIESNNPTINVEIENSPDMIDITPVIDQ